MAGKGKPGAKTAEKKKDDSKNDESFEPIKVEARLANTTILMLESPEDEIVQKACESIFKFCEKNDNNKLIVHELGATAKLYELLSHEERAVQRNATMAFGLLSACSEVRKYLRLNPSSIDKMITLLQPDVDALTNEYAAMWLRNMCEDFSTKTVVASSQNAMNSLISMLESKDADAVFNSLGCLDRLMADYQPRQLIRELKGIDPILNLIRSEYPQIQELAFSALTKITQNAENRETLRELGGLDKLVDFLGSHEHKDMHVNCLNVLSNCLEDTQCLDLIQLSGGLTKILAYCQELSDENAMSQVNAAAARALARSARKAENRKILNEQSAEKMLIYLLLCDNDETKAAAAHALSVMAESNFSQDAIRNYDGIETLVRLLTNENSKIREYSCLALSNLTYKNHNNCRHILANQGIDQLVGLMKDEKDTTKAYACICLTNMGSDEIIREEVGQFSFCQSLIPALSSSNTLAQSKACLALAAYCVDSSIRNELKSSGVTACVVDLLKSKNDEVRSNACWAVTCCAYDHGIAIDFCRNGAIETLRDINQSSQRQSSFTDTALKKLLEANLSAKYAFVNYLEPTDYVMDGFYDMGPMRPSGKFHHLDDLFTIPVNDKRPVIIVYAPDEKKPTSPENILKSESVTGKMKSSSKTAQSPAASVTSMSKGKDSKGRKQSVTNQKTTHAPPSASNSIHDDSKNETIYGMSLYKPVFDKDLRYMIDQCKDMYQTMSTKNQVIKLGQFVADRMGGPVGRDEIVNLGYELAINEIKYELKTNIIPLGKIYLGTYYHRALLFKILADKLFIKVSLERGDYNRAWNKVAIKDENSNLPPKFYIVDLMHEPGKLMEMNTLDAIQYTKL